MADQEKPDSAKKQIDTSARRERPRRRRATKKQSQSTRLLPPWKVILHNDDANRFDDVVKVVRQLIRLSEQEAVGRVREAGTTGTALLVVTHQERAELYVEQFASFDIMATADPDT